MEQQVAVEKLVVDTLDRGQLPETVAGHHPVENGAQRRGGESDPR